MHAPADEHGMAEGVGVVPRSLRTRIGDWLHLMSWAFARFNRRKLAPKVQKRLLVIYDLQSQTFTVGDPLDFQAVAVALREQWNLEEVDFALVHESALARSANQWGLSELNFPSRLNQILPSAQVNERLGSLFLFDSHKQLDEFLQDNIRRYEIWPPGFTYKLGKNIKYRIFNEILYDYARERGRLPVYHSRPVMASWARQFCADNVLPDVLVTINIRNNPRWGSDRNLNVDVWLKFLGSCRGRYPVRFVIVCAKEEVDVRLRALDHVMIAKDFETNVEQDVALIDIAAFHMGASSGVCSKAMFGDAPYCIVRTDVQPASFRGMSVEDGHLRFFGARVDQRFWTGSETLELLTLEFDRMWSGIDPDRWRAELSAAPERTSAYSPLSDKCG